MQKCVFTEIVGLCSICWIRILVFKNHIQLVGLVYFTLRMYVNIPMLSLVFLSVNLILTKKISDYTQPWPVTILQVNVNWMLTYVDKFIGVIFPGKTECKVFWFFSILRKSNFRWQLKKSNYNLFLINQGKQVKLLVAQSILKSESQYSLCVVVWTCWSLRLLLIATVWGEPQNI